MQTDKIRKCPKCGNDADHYTEICTGKIDYPIIDGKIERNGMGFDRGGIEKIRAYCNRCDYEWTVRGAHQIDQLFA